MCNQKRVCNLPYKEYICHLPIRLPLSLCPHHGGSALGVDGSSEPSPGGLCGRCPHPSVPAGTAPVPPGYHPAHRRGTQRTLLDGIPVPLQRLRGLPTRLSRTHRPHHGRAGYLAPQRSRCHAATYPGRCSHSAADHGVRHRSHPSQSPCAPHLRPLSLSGELDGNFRCRILYNNLHHLHQLHKHLNHSDIRV